MPEEALVRIGEWPAEPARLEHVFDADKPCPVSISFGTTPARVLIASAPERPLAVDMNMAVVARDTIPVCIKVCEPICARSEYSIGIALFDRPFISIVVRGMTKIANCNEG